MEETGTRGDLANDTNNLLDALDIGHSMCYSFIVHSERGNTMTPAPTIQTVEGIKYLVAIETENACGAWNDSYRTKDGFYVIHDGPMHLVYHTEKPRTVLL